VSLPAGRSVLLIRATAGPGGDGGSLATTIVSAAPVAFDAEAGR